MSRIRFDEEGCHPAAAFEPGERTAQLAVVAAVQTEFEIVGCLRKASA